MVSTTSVSSMASRSGSTPWSRPTCSNRRSRTARHATSTAPPDIQVWRDADVDPAEPIDVSVGSSTTSSTPSTLRAICSAIVTKPWPTSAVANLSQATPSASRQRAVAESSKPSEYMRFLMATANPTPRRMCPDSAVRPAPPGSRIGSSSRPPTGSIGRGSAAVSRMQRAIGATLSTT